MEPWEGPEVDTAAEASRSRGAPESEGPSGTFSFPRLVPAPGLEPTFKDLF